MNSLFLISLCSILTNAFGYESLLDTLKITASPQTQENAVYDLLKRIIPRNATKFYIHIDPSLGPESKDTFKIHRLTNNTVKISGTSGVAAATGFHHYLKYYCFCHISWEASNLKLPNILPEANITITSNDRFRYYQNVCTTSYSFVWWNWPEWENHIDWMALNSFNLILAFNGQEAVWKRIYKKLNLTDLEIGEHFTGPAFLSWGRMGNIRGWGGSLSESWHIKSINLQHKILKRMRSFGMIPVLPAFSGHVPRAFKRLFPNASMVETETWNNFNDTYCCPYLLNPTDSLFKTIGNMFIIELTAEFGTDHAYSSDTFNEMRPSNANLTFINSIGRSVYEAMASVDSKAVWIMQNWLFVHDPLFWTEKRAEALLTSVPKGRMLVLDLQSEQHPQYQRLKSYYGQPYIWCMLHNFGGTLGMFGSVDIINKDIFLARNAVNSTLIGTGITPEGINQNYVVYDLMIEMGWRKEPVDLTEWFSQYAKRRYGRNDNNADAAWQIFKNTVYNYTGLLPMRGKFAVNRRPGSRFQTWIWYDSCDFLQAWDLLLQASNDIENNSAYLHDLVDTTRQVLQVLGDQYYKEIIKAFNMRDLFSFQDSSALFLELLSDMDKILMTNKAFLLGQWLSAAKTAGNSNEEKSLYEYNARNQITLWGPNGEIVDYANKQWSGIISNFSLPRWSLFLNQMNESLAQNTRFHEGTVIQKIFQEVEAPFSFDRNIFPDTPSGDTVKVAQYIRNKWWTRRHCRHTRSEKYNLYENLESLDLLEMYNRGKSNPKVIIA